MPWRRRGRDGGFTGRAERQCSARPSDRPGLGIEINEDEVARHPFEQELPQRVFYADGSVGDW